METAESILQSFNLRNTRPRRLLLALVKKNRNMLTLNEAYVGLSNDMDRATVYRTLKSFTDCGLLHQFQGPDQQPVYELCNHKHTDGEPHSNHAHFVCNSCKKIVCIDDNQNAIKQDLPAGFSAEEVVVVIKGTCGNCGE